MHCRVMRIASVWQAAGAANFQHAVTGVSLSAGSVRATPIIIEPLAELVLLVRMSGGLIEVALVASISNMCKRPGGWQWKSFGQRRNHHRNHSLGRWRHHAWL